MTKNTNKGHFLAKMGFSRNNNVQTLFYVPAKFQIRPMIENAKNQGFSGGSLNKNISKYHDSPVFVYFHLMILVRHQEGKANRGYVGGWGGVFLL